MKPERVVVTGVGVVSSIGIGRIEFWDSLLAGRSGIDEITAFDTSQFPTHRGGEVKKFLAEHFFSVRQIRYYDRASQFAIVASRLALEDGGLSLIENRSLRIGISVGTTMAEAQAIEAINSTWVKNGEKTIRGQMARRYPGNMIAAHVASELKLNGPISVFGTACAAGNYAIARGFDLLRMHRTDAVLAGGADAFSRIAFMGFNRLLAVAPEKCQPFDRNRKGMMVGEGSGILLLERLSDALARKANIYAEIFGYGMSCDAQHMTIPDVEGVQRVIVNAIEQAGISKEDIGYISAHGTGTQANDRTECAAIRSVFGESTDKIPVSSIKSMLGHTMGAASALEAIACVLGVNDSEIPPTINYEVPDPECDIDCVPNKSRKKQIQVALNNSFAFGGNNSCLVVGVYA